LNLSKELKGKVTPLNKYTELLNEKADKLEVFEIDTNTLDGISNACAQLKFMDNQVKAKRFVELVKILFSFKKACSALSLGGANSSILFKSFDENHAETRMALLALLWYCCKDDKSLLKDYYQELNKIKLSTEKKSIFKLSPERKREIEAKFGMEPGWEATAGESKELPINLEEYQPGWGAWVGLVYSTMNRENIAQRLGQDLTDVENVEAVFMQQPDLYEKFVWLQLLSGRYPTISVLLKATLWYNGKTFLKPNAKPSIPEDKFIRFTDCMDSTMMNMCCIVAYNPDIKNFDVEYLKRKLRILQINPKLEAFFAGDHPAFEKKLSNGKTKKILPTPENIEDLAVHGAWTDVVTNVPGITYNTCFRNGREEAAPFKGFIFLRAQDKEIVLDLASAGYSPILEDGVCFVMQPTIKNFIVLLNYLLNLNLFNPQNVCTEILKPDFIKTYLPMLAEKLKIGLKPSVSLDDIDARDYGRIIHTSLFLEESSQPQFRLSTCSDHGELELQPIQFEEGKVVNLVAKHLTYNSDNIPCLRGLRLNGLDNSEIAKGSWIIGNNINWPDMYWFSDILSKSKCEKLLIAIKSKSGIVNDIVAKMFMRIADQQPDERIKIDLYCSMIQSLSNPILINKSIKVASMGIARENFNVQRSALKLFRALFENKHGFPEAKVAIQFGLQSEDKDVKAAAEQLGVLVQEYEK